MLTYATALPMRIKSFSVLCLLAGVISATGGPADSTRKPALDPEWGVGSWIWDKTTFDKQACRLWRSFEIPQGAVVTRARFRIAADNSYRLLLDGRELGRGTDWKYMTEYDLTWLLSAGQHVLAVEAFNETLQAGLLAGLRLEYVDGQVMEIGTDGSWRVVPEVERNWEKKKQPSAQWPNATVIQQFGEAPWNTKPLRVTLVPPLLPIKLHFWQTGLFQILLLSICGIVVVTCLRLAAKLAVQSKAQELLGRERARIARDIHDDLGAGLTRLVLLGEVVQSEMPAESRHRTQIEQLCTWVRDLLGTIDEVIWAVNSRRDTLADFITHVSKYAEAYLESTAIRCRLDLETDLPEVVFDLPVRRNLFLAVKEAIGNAAKHSGATELFLRIHRLGEDVLVQVEDNGRGFEPKNANPERNGLSNMQQRMHEIGGSFAVVSRPGGGCRIEFKAPLATKSKRWRLWGADVAIENAIQKQDSEQGEKVIPLPPPEIAKSSSRLYNPTHE